MTAVVDTAHTTSTINGSGTSVALTKPASTAVGDLLVAGLSFVCTGTPTLAPPAGWTLVDSLPWDNLALTVTAVYVRVVDGSEGASFTFDVTQSGSAYGGNGIMLRVTGAASSSPVDVHASQEATTGSTGTFPSVTTTAGSELVLGFANQGGGGTPSGTQWNSVAPSGTTLVSAQNSGTFDYLGFISFTQATAGATGAKTVPTLALATNTNWQGITLAIKSFTVTGTAAPVLPGFTVAATGHLDETGTIAAALPGLVTAALGHLDESGTATALLPGFSAAATGVIGGVSGSAVANLPGFSVAVSGTLNESGTAALSLAAFKASATGHLDETGTGIGTLAALKAAGTGHLDETGTVTASLPGLTVAVTGSVGAGGPIGSIAAILPGLIAAAAGHLDEAGSVVASIPAFQAALIAHLDETGTIIAILPAFGFSGVQSRWRRTSSTVHVWLATPTAPRTWTANSNPTRVWTPT